MNKDTPNPDGGVILRMTDGPLKGEPSGVFAERAKTKYLDRFNKKLQNNA